MNASTVTSTGRAMDNPPVPVQHLLLTEFSQGNEVHWSDNLDADNIALRATQVTAVLKDILQHDSYRHGGLNE